MKTLYLIRHATSDNGYHGQDFGRGLSEKGIKDIKQIGKFLKAQKIKPDLIIASPATRAKITAQSLAKKLKYKKRHIKYHQEIYDTHMKGHDVALSILMDVGNCKERRIKTFFHKIMHQHICLGKSESSFFHGLRKRMSKWYCGRCDSIAFIGHNMAISSLAYYLSGKDVGHMSPCSVLALEFDIDKWSDIAITKGKEKFYKIPNGTNGNNGK